MKQMINRLLALYCVVIALTSCSPSKLDEALALAGENRGELEKVLQHYSSPADSLKWQAARFLIENMPGHYTLRGDTIDYYRQIIDQDTAISYYYKKLYNITLTHFIQNDKNTRREEDIKHVTAAYLVRHIDASFELAEKQKILDVIPFDFFLEYVLPYRFDRESLDLWRDSIQVTTPEKIWNTLSYNVKYLKANFKLKSLPKNNPKLINKLLQTNPLGDCYFIAYQDMWEYRSVGIPAIIHSIPFYSNRNGYHYWRSDPPVLYHPTIALGALDRRTAKIYRHTFSRNHTLIPEQDEYIPKFFQNPFIQDITDQYNSTIDIQIENNSKSSSRYAYLCVFNNLEWKPIVAGEVSHGKATFRQISKNIVYLPVYCDSSGTFHPFNYPFILNSKGTVKHLIPSSEVTTLRLERKNPDLTSSLTFYSKFLSGTVVEASDHKNFTRTDTVFILNTTDKLYYKVHNIHPVKKYQWYRIHKMRNKSIAELYFLNSKGEQIHGSVDSVHQAAIDGNPLTITSLRDKELVIHFPTPVTIHQLVCLPRNDGNGIYPDNLYELFYFNSDGWQSLGMQQGDNFYLEYDNVPRNALYWLRNLTSGREERIFTSANGEIVFW